MERLDRRVSLKMEKELYEQLEELAEKERRSLNNLILFPLHL
ncbi:ribbon-helix-helix protein, CopG family [bacterium]|nr:ribbon-helix-helix protein, CopG family [bacterium]